MELHAQKGCLKLNAGEYWERWMAFITVPWEQPPIVHIEEKEQAINRHKVIEKQYKGRKGSLLVYTDGSAHGGHVGAAAVIGNSSKYRQLYMGLGTQSTVYAAELQGIRMGLLPAVHDARVRELFIFTDNQAAIQAIYRPRQPSGQEVIAEIWNYLRSLRGRGTGVSIHWIPGHEGIPGNEEADKRAKAAAGMGKEVQAEQGSGKQCKLASAAKRVIRQKAVDEWADAWKKTKVAAPTRRLLKAPTRKSRKLYLGLRKAHSSV